MSEALPLGMPTTARRPRFRRGTLTTIIGRIALALFLGVWMLPVTVLLTGLLMISNIRYPHLVNRYMRGKKSISMLLASSAMVGFLRS